MRPGRAALVGAAALLAAGTAQAEYEVTGNIGVVSDYVLRGWTTSGTESDGPAVQGGFDVSDANGLYAGWWASSLGYGTATLPTTIENDLYAGYGGELNGFSYDVGLLYYWYMDDSDSSGFEPYVSLGWGPVSLAAAYMATDTSWSNQGDIYWTLGVDLDLGLGFGLSLLGGYYTYESSGRHIPASVESSTFQHVDLTISRSIGDTPASMFATYVVGGKDRQGISQTDKIVLGFGYDFSIF